MQRRVFTVILDANTVYKEGLKRVLENTRYQIVKDVAGGDKLAAKLAARHPRDVLILLGMETDAADSAAAVRRCRNAYPESCIVVLNGRGEPHSVTAALAAGADAYLDKAMPKEVLVRSLDLIMLGQKVVPPQILQSLCEGVLGAEASEAQNREGEPRTLSRPANLNGSASQNGFSNREAAVLACLMRGDSNKGIARHLRMAEATVKVHVKAILRKVHAKNRTQAAIWAANHLCPQDGDSPNGDHNGALGI